MGFTSPKLSSFIDWCCYYTQVSYTGSWEPLVKFQIISDLENISFDMDCNKISYIPICINFSVFYVK
jgi:hypothetical protein